MSDIVLASGRINIPRQERVHDTYRYVVLESSDSKGWNQFSLPQNPSIRKQGKIVARVVGEHIAPYHLGDIARGVAPSQDPLPKGTEVVLGKGIPVSCGNCLEDNVLLGIAVPGKFSWRKASFNVDAFYQVSGYPVEILFRTDNA